MADKKIDRSLLASILDRSGDPATVAWAHEGTGDVNTLTDPALAIAAAAELGNVAALQSVTGPKDLRKAAAAGLHKLRSKGIKIEEKLAPVVVSLGLEQITVPSRAFLTFPRFDGTVEMSLTATDATGSCALIVRFGGTDGLRNCEHGHMGRGDLRRFCEDVVREGGVEIPFSTGLYYADRLLGPRRESNWNHFLEHVPAATLQSARILDPLRHAPPPADAPEIDWVFPFALFNGQAVLSGAQRLATLLIQTVPQDQEMTPAEQALLKEVANLAVSDSVRQRLLAHLDVLRASFAFHGLPLTSLDQAQAALSDGTPVDEIPAVLLSVRRAMLTEMLSNLGPSLNNLSNREDANFDEQDFESDEFEEQYGVEEEGQYSEPDPQK